jgi:hypothetical protein
MQAETMETQTLTPFEISFRLQSLYCIIDEGMRIGIWFDSLTDAVRAYCEPDFIEPSHYGCESFEEVAELLCQQRRHLYNYPNLD